jgi:hypothetical protein
MVNFLNFRGLMLRHGGEHVGQAFSTISFQILDTILVLWTSCSIDRPNVYILLTGRTSNILNVALKTRKSATLLTPRSRLYLAAWKAQERRYV